MSVNFSTTTFQTFKGNAKSVEQCNHHVCDKCGQVVTDSFKSEEEKPKKEKGFFTRLKDGFINIRKAFINFGYIAAGTVKGALYGTAAGLTVAGVAAARNVIKKAPKTLGIGGKILAGVAGVAVMAGTIFKSKLDANEAAAKLDHRWATGHNE